MKKISSSFALLIPLLCWLWRISCFNSFLASVYSEIFGYWFSVNK